MAGLEAVAQNGSAAKDGIWGGTPGTLAQPRDALCVSSAHCPGAMLVEKVPDVGGGGEFGMSAQPGTL